MILYSSLILCKTLVIRHFPIIGKYHSICSFNGLQNTTYRHPGGLFFSIIQFVSLIKKAGLLMESPPSQRLYLFDYMFFFARRSSIASMRTSFKQLFMEMC